LLRLQRQAGNQAVAGLIGTPSRPAGRLGNPIQRAATSDDDPTQQGTSLNVDYDPVLGLHGTGGYAGYSGDFNVNSSGWGAGAQAPNGAHVSAYSANSGAGAGAGLDDDHFGRVGWQRGEGVSAQGKWDDLAGSLGVGDAGYHADLRGPGGLAAAGGVDWASHSGSAGLNVGGLNVGLGYDPSSGFSGHLNYQSQASPSATSGMLPNLPGVQDLLGL
jgi:hypothetical protein